MWKASHVPDRCVCVCAQSLSHVWFFVTPWTVACQAPLSMRFSTQEYWSGLLFPPPEDLPNPGIKLESLESQASSVLAGRFFTTVPPGKPKRLLDIGCLIYDGFLFFPYPKYLNSLLKQNIKPLYFSKFFKLFMEEGNLSSVGHRCFEGMPVLEEFSFWESSKRYWARGAYWQRKS